MYHSIAFHRHQLALASDDGALKDSQIQQLIDDVEKAGVRIQEKETELTQHHLEVLNDLRVTLAKQEEIIENQRMEIEQLKFSLQEKSCQLYEREEHVRRVSEEVAAIKDDRNSIQPMDQVWEYACTCTCTRYTLIYINSHV